MYDRQFFDTKLGQAALASIGAMIMLIAVSTQFEAAHGPISPLAFGQSIVEIA